MTSVLSELIYNVVLNEFEDCTLLAVDNIFLLLDVYLNATFHPVPAGVLPANPAREQPWDL